MHAYLLFRPVKESQDAVESAVDALALDFDLSLQSPTPAQPDEAAPEDMSTPRLGDSFLQQRSDEYAEGSDAAS